MPGRPAPGGTGRAPGGSGRPSRPTGRAPGGRGRPSRPIGLAPGRQRPHPRRQRPRTGGSGRTPGGSGRPSRPTGRAPGGSGRTPGGSGRPRRQRPHPGRQRTAVGPRLPGPDLTGPRLPGTRRTGTGLALARLARPWLTGTRLRRTCLTGAGPARASLAGTRLALARTSLSGPAWLPGWPAAALAGATLRGAFVALVRTGLAAERAGRPPPADERSLSATSWLTVDEWLLASTPMEDSLASRVLGRDPKLFGDLIHPRVAQPDLTSLSSLERGCRLASATCSLNTRFLRRLDGGVGRRRVGHLQGSLDAAPPHRPVQAGGCPHR
jgi:hypothetical protein